MTEATVVPFFKVPVVRSRPHLRFVSYLGCVVPGCRWWLPPPVSARALEGIRTHGPGYVETNPYVTWHHVRRSSNAGTAIKPGDQFALGVCDRHHKAIHQAGEKTCAAEWGIDLMEEAARLAAMSRALGILP